MERGKDIAEKFYSRSRYVSADIKFVDLNLFRITICDIFCLICVYLNTEFSNGLFES